MNVILNLFENGDYVDLLSERLPSRGLMRLAKRRYRSGGTGVSSCRGISGTPKNTLTEPPDGKGIAITPGVIFSPRGDYKHHIRMSCGQVEGETMREGVVRLGEIAHRV